MNANPTTAHLKPWKPGETSSRSRSKEVEQMLRTARKNGNEGMLFAVKVMRDDGVDVRVRLKAAEMIIERAMPRNPDTIAAMLGDGFTSHLTISFVNVPPAVTIDQPAGTNRDDQVAHTNGHDPSPLTITFVNPEEC